MYYVGCVCAKCVPRLRKQKRLKGQKICFPIKSHLFSTSSLHHRMLCSLRDGTGAHLLLDWSQGQDGAGLSLVLRSSSPSGLSAPYCEATLQGQMIWIWDLCHWDPLICSSSLIPSGMSEIQELAPHLTVGQETYQGEARYLHLRASLLNTALAWGATFPPGWEPGFLRWTCESLGAPLCTTAGDSLLNGAPGISTDGITD